MFTLDQFLITVIIICFLFVIFALLIDKLGGLFLSRNPFDFESYTPNKENEFERKIGMSFVTLVYQLCNFIIPICFLLINNIGIKIIGTMYMIITVYRISKSK